MISPLRGEIYWVDWTPARGSEQTGRRLAVVIQTNLANSNPRYQNTIVACLSAKGHLIPTHVEVLPSRENGLTQASYVKCEQLFTVSKIRLGARIDTVGQSLLHEIDASLKAVLSLDGT